MILIEQVLYARAMVMDYGMSDEIGTISYGSDNNEVFLEEI